MCAVSPIALDGRLRRNTLEKLESAFPRPKKGSAEDSTLVLKFTDVTILISFFFMIFIFWVIEDL